MNELYIRTYDSSKDLHYVVRNIGDNKHIIVTYPISLEECKEYIERQTIPSTKQLTIFDLGVEL